MLLRSVTSFYVQSKNGDKLICSLRGSSAFPSSSTLSFPSRKHGRNLGVYASIDASNLAFTGVMFQPFEEVKEELHIPIAHNLSLNRQRYVEDCESTINV
ncbi:hypothetical protein GQ457_12G008550 [Hibiscus cannabinus]